MSIVTPNELKSQLRLNTTAEDSLLQEYIDAAEETFKSLTLRTLDSNAMTGFPSIPASVKIAIKLLASHYYRVREAYGEQTVEEMPFGFISICRRYSTQYVSPGVL